MSENEIAVRELNPLPLVSIIVPAYNAERFLCASLDSIVAQSYPAKEILVMDDASTDRTGEIARAYGDRILYYRQPRNRGQFGNVDDGIARARGKYIAVYHADDIYHPEIVAREAAFLESHPQAGAVFALDIFINAAGKEWGRLKLPPGIRGGELLDYRTVLNTILRRKNCLFPAPSSMVRADVYRAVGPYRGREFPVAGDFEMFFRIARRYPVAILDEYLFQYRWGHGNADQIDRLLRTTTEPYFNIMDEHLAAGAGEFAHPGALAAHEAHRSEDALMRAMSSYIVGDRGSMRSALDEASCRRILASGHVQRFRLTVLFGLLAALSRLPQAGAFERAFRRRWFSHVEPARFEHALRLRSAAAQVPGELTR
jgi:Glycosyl transferase family 2